jgi:hypothetical protein
MTSEVQRSTANLPTPSEALRMAVAMAGEAGRAPDDIAATTAIGEGRLWLSIARELREGAMQIAAAPPGDRLTLHDVEGIVCSHGRVAIRRKNTGAERWYLHTDDGSNCSEPQETIEQFRRRTNGKPFSLGCSLHGGLADEHGAWIDCGIGVCGHGPQDVRPPALAAEQPNSLRAVQRSTSETEAKLRAAGLSAEAGTPTYGEVTEAAMRTEVIEVMSPASGRIADYWKGQIPAPSELAVRYATELRRAVVAGESIPGTEKWAPETWSDMSALVGEILTRHEQGRTETAPIARPYVSEVAQQG